MILKSVEFVQYEGKDQEWRLKNFSLGPVNLLVGKNATGKSRSLKIINGLANLVSSEGKVSISTGSFIVEFQHEGQRIVYKLNIQDSRAKHEIFELEGKKLLERYEGGSGTIWGEKLGDYIEFQTPDNKLAVVSRRDNIQHPFFECLHDWGKALRYYPFGTPLGKQNYAVFKEEDNEPLDTKNVEQVVAIFRKGLQLRSEDFLNSIVSDMGAIGYSIENVGLARPVAVSFREPVSNPMGLFVQESDLRGVTEQDEMSQGMFRALSIIIQLNYSYFADEPSCILIDDIGEGLDFDRSSALIKLLVEKAEDANVQLVMATNDRFVMNNVPLEKWSVLQRDGGDCQVYNYAKHAKIFDEFKFTGLNNFDFLATDFIKGEAGGDE
jgi:energy-coupling factor transporter ATP-binding protein EcfA2